MKTVFNAEALVLVKVRDKTPCLYLHFEQEKKSFWRGNVKEGFYGYTGEFKESGPFTKDQLEAGAYMGVELIVEDHKAYYKPYVELSFAGGANTSKSFQSLAEAKRWAQEQVRKGINVTIEI